MHESFGLVEREKDLEQELFVLRLQGQGKAIDDAACVCRCRCRCVCADVMGKCVEGSKRMSRYNCM